MEDAYEEEGMSEDGGKVDIPDCIESKEESDACLRLGNQFFYPYFNGEPSGCKTEMGKNVLQEETCNVDCVTESVEPLAQDSSLATVPFHAMDYVEMLIAADSQGKLGNLNQDDSTRNI
ncbi:hypothetical protein ABZP36_027055 [Zizania latifolia]